MSDSVLRRYLNLDTAACGNGYQDTGPADRRPDHAAESDPGTAAPWESPTPLGGDYATPSFPTRELPSWLADWVEAEAQATQTPPDLAAMLSLPIAGSALAKRFRVQIRQGWTEPINLLAEVTLLSGERKSAVFADALRPVQAFESEERERMAPVIAELTSEHRILEAKLKNTEVKAAKASDPAENHQLKTEAKQLAKELAAHKVPDPPQVFCDDETPENLAKLLARQGERILQASPEGTAFEIAKGRYSEVANFDVYLKGHAGDPLRVGRVSRDSDVAEQPALSAALAVQPDVIQGLADQTSMRGRGFLARWLYSIPASIVGRRRVAPPPVPAKVSARYHETMLALWRLPGAVDQAGKPAPHWLQFSPAADRAMRAFEQWLEPQLADGAELSHLAGWANKLAGATARIAAILHVAGMIGDGKHWQASIPETTVASAIRIGRDYLLPHALAVFGIMGVDPKVEAASRVWRWIAGRCEYSESSEYAPPSFSRRDIHQGTRRLFRSADDLGPVLDLLVKYGYLRPQPQSGKPGRGHKSPVYDVNPLALAAHKKEGVHTHCTQRRHSGVGPVGSEDSEDATSPDGTGDAWEG